MPECSCRASTRLCSDGFPLKACGNDISKVLFSFCFQYITEKMQIVFSQLLIREQNKTWQLLEKLSDKRINW